MKEHERWQPHGIRRIRAGKPGLSWVGLGPRVGEDQSKMVDSRGAQIGRAANGTFYPMLRASNRGRLGTRC
jgi:hypothetical protein